MNCTECRWVLGWVIVAWASSVLMPSAEGQGRQNWGRNNRNPQPASGPPVESSGTIEAFSGGVLQLTTTSNETWLVKIAPKAKVRVKGKAKLDFLRPGMVISFTGDVDKRRSVIEEKITKLTIVTPSETRPLGAFPSQVGGGTQEQMSAAPGAGGTAQASESFDIVGHFGGVNRKGNAAVVVPNNYFKQNLTVEIAEDADIDLDVADASALALAKKGDKVDAKGPQIGPTRMIATNLTLTLAEPLTTVQAENDNVKKPAPRRNSRTRKGRDESEAATDPTVEEKTTKPVRKEVKKRDNRRTPGTLRKADEENGVDEEN